MATAPKVKIVKVFGNRFTSERTRRGYKIFVFCECGHSTNVTATELLEGSTYCIDCSYSKPQDLQRFGIDAEELEAWKSEGLSGKQLYEKWRK